MRYQFKLKIYSKRLFTYIPYPYPCILILFRSYFPIKFPTAFSIKTFSISYFFTSTLSFFSILVLHIHSILYIYIFNFQFSCTRDMTIYPATDKINTAKVFSNTIESSFIIIRRIWSTSFQDHNIIVYKDLYGMKKNKK